MTTDPLHRLTAGLAEEERIARAALGQDHVHETFCDSDRCVHDRRQDPASTLDRVEAIQKAIAACRVAAAKAKDSDERFNSHYPDVPPDLRTESAWDDGFESGCREALKLLASIYPEDATAEGEV